MVANLDIRVLGELEVRLDGVPLALPQSRKTRALLAYLAVQRAPQRRDALCQLLWEMPDDPRAALRWSLTKLRPLLNSPDAERLQADRERVCFEQLGARVDLAHVREACAGDPLALSVDELRALAGLFRGPFLAGLDLAAQPAFESWRLGQQEQARRLHLCVLDALAAKLDGDEERSAVLRTRIELDPGDEAAHAQLIAELARAGAGVAAQQQHEASVRMLASIGPYDQGALEQALRQQRAKLAPGARSRVAPHETLRQDVRFCVARDGARIAYATVGSGPPLVKTANWLNHLEYDWESPVWRHIFHAFGGAHTFVRYDARGNGLSDWEVDDHSLDALVSDLEAVVDAAGLERFPLLGISQGCAISVEYAARHPERVSKLVLYGGYARGWKLRDNPEQVQAQVMLTRTGWGRDNPAYRQLFTSLFIPGATQEQMDWFNELQRITTTPETAATMMLALGDIDVRHRLAHVTAPTLVMHARRDARVTLPNGRELAAGIPGARFVILESQNHIPLEQEPATARFLNEIATFLAE